MSVSTLLTSVDVELPGEIYGGFADQFDTSGVQADFVDALEALARVRVPSIYLARNGQVFVDLTDVDRALEIDWDDLKEEVDFESILIRNEVN